MSLSGASSGRLKADECLSFLSNLKVVERNALVNLNNGLVNLVENFHYAQAHHELLVEEMNRLRGGLANQSATIDSIYESELAAVKSGVRDRVSARQKYETDIPVLQLETNQVREQWLQSRNLSRGIPDDVDEELKRITEIECENLLVVRRIKFMEKKCTDIQRMNTCVVDDIHLYRMRLDKEVLIRNEYGLRTKDLLNSIHMLSTSHSHTIEQEMTYLRQSMTPDSRSLFRDQLMSALSDIRREYETKSSQSLYESEQRIHRIIEGTSHHDGVIRRDQQVEEMLHIMRETSEMQRRVSELESRNLFLQQELENITYEIDEAQRLFEADIQEKDALIEKLRAHCTELNLEMEKLCDRYTDLLAEISRYRDVLDGIARPVPSHFRPPTHQPPPQPIHRPEPSPLPTYETSVHQSSTQRPEPSPMPLPTYETSVYQSSTQRPEPSPMTLPTYETSVYQSSTQRPAPSPGPLPTYETSVYQSSTQRPGPSPMPLPTYETSVYQSSAQRPAPSPGPLPTYQLSTYRPHVPSPLLPLPQPYQPAPYVSHASDATSIAHSFSERPVSPGENIEHVQTCTRWFKGYICVMNVDEKFVLLENRSDQHFVEIGGWTIVHQLDDRVLCEATVPDGVYLDPKETYEIHAGNGALGTLAADIAQFNTTIRAKTLAIKDKKVRAWFVYNSTC